MDEADGILPPAAAAPTDKRPLVTAQVTRGLVRALGRHGFACLPEVTLANGRRADVFALGPDGEIRIVEVKSSVEDFQVDGKWPEYLEFCERFSFAVPLDFPVELLPAEHGYWSCDAWDAEELRPSPFRPLNASRRKALMLLVARLALGRLQELAAFAPPP